MDVDYMAGEDDMTFFESEDDKWMMGDFDIDLDVDVGRPINFEADESAANQDDSGFLEANLSGNVDPRNGTPSVSDPTASAFGHNNNNSGLRSSINGNNSSAQRPGGSNPVNSTSAGVNPNGNGNKAVRFQPLPHVRSNINNGTSGGNGNNRGQLPGGSNGNGGRTNSPNSTSTAQPSGSGNSRPSAGGFSFPPGLVRVTFLLRCSFVRELKDHDQNQSSGIGSKRPAEAMLQHPQQQ